MDARDALLAGHHAFQHGWGDHGPWFKLPKAHRPPGGEEIVQTIEALL
jgi:hypothetical protein